MAEFERKDQIKRIASTGPSPPFQNQLNALPISILRAAFIGGMAQPPESAQFIWMILERIRFLDADQSRYRI